MSKNIKLGPADLALVLRSDGKLETVTPAVLDELSRRAFAWALANGIEQCTSEKDVDALVAHYSQRVVSITDEIETALSAHEVGKLLRFFCGNETLQTLAFAMMKGGAQLRVIEVAPGDLAVMAGEVPAPSANPNEVN